MPIKTKLSIRPIDFEAILPAKKYLYAFDDRGIQFFIANKYELAVDNKAELNYRKYSADSILTIRLVSINLEK